MSKYSQDDDGNIYHSDHGKLNRSLDGTLRHPNSYRVIGKHTAWNNRVEEPSLFGGPPETATSQDHDNGSSSDTGGAGAWLTPILKLAAAAAIFGGSLFAAQVVYSWLSAHMPYWAAGTLIVPIIVLGAVLTDAALMRWLFPGLAGFLMVCALWATLAGILAQNLMSALGWWNLAQYVAIGCAIMAAIVRWSEGRAIGEREMPGLFGRQVVRLRDWAGYQWHLVFGRR